MPDVHLQQRAIEHARDLFLAGEDVSGTVRDTILRSWQRSLVAGVHPSGPRSLPHRGAVDPDGVFLRAVRTVVEPIFSEMQTDGVAVLVSDADGRLLGRWADDRPILDMLDRVSAAPGYDCSEELAGTTALGTVLEEQHPIAVRGAEHYASVYRNLSAFGAPIFHPVSGVMQGAVDFASTTDAASELMVPLVIRIANEIGACLLSGYSAADRALLDGYLRADRRGQRRPIVAINERVLIANPLASDVLVGIDSQLLHEKVARAIADGRRSFVLREGEVPVYAHVAPIDADGGLAGAVVQFRRAEVDASRHLSRRSDSEVRISRLLPGASLAWQKLRSEIAIAADGRQRILLVGEQGVGKREVATAIVRAAAGATEPLFVDVGDLASRSPSDWTTDLVGAAERNAAVVLTRLDLAADSVLERLSAIIDKVGDAVWIIATMRASPRLTAPPASIAARFTHVLEVPPLRERVADIPALIESFAPLAHGSAAYQLDDQVERTLSRLDWPGNVRQLKNVVLAAARTSAGRRITVNDLPPKYREPQRKKNLSRLEISERATIAAALRIAAGNKTAAAADLGISRATLYRRLSALGLQ